MSRVLPILFNTEMVRATLDWRKTATRRLVKPQPEDDTELLFCEKIKNKTVYGFSDVTIAYPPYEKGDILYVREAFNYLPIPEPLAGTSKTYWYRADGEEPGDKWRPSIHMPKEAARIWLKVTAVWAEHLQDITIDEAIKEGCADLWVDEVKSMRLIDVAGNKNQFTYIWNSTIQKSDIDKYGWAANPWVWVIEFERCEKLERG